LLLVLNSGEPGGGALTLQDLALVFCNPTAGTTFTATLPATPLLFSSTAAGSGQGGFAFRLDATEAAFASAFFSGSDNRAGVAATVSGSAGGLDRFVFAAGSSPTAIPEPHQLPILFSGLSAMALIRMAARRKKAG